VRLAVLGGSFNPIHVGHLFLADAALCALGYDRVALVPAFRSPFKQDAQGMEGSARDRLDMIAASISGDPRIALDDCEIRRGGVSYTADTLADIARRHAPSGKIGLVIGDDLAADFPRWRRSAEILEMADVIVARRLSPGAGGGAPAESLPFPRIRLDNAMLEVSSSAASALIREGGAWRYLVPPGAREIIEARGLYGARPSRGLGGAPASAGPAAARAEDAARAALGQERFLHSRGTALMAWDLCRRFSLDPESGYLAGVAHDIAKQLDDRAQLRLAKSWGAEISSVEMEKPSLLHGAAGAALLKKNFGVRSRDILEAVAAHTGGRRGMGPLAKAVYIADKMEPSRECDPDLRRLACEGGDLDEIFLAVLARAAADTRARKRRVLEETLRVLEETEALVRKRKKEAS
jgi:nicotinate-nucleotide adenylyltransferase